MADNTATLTPRIDRRPLYVLAAIVAVIIAIAVVANFKESASDSTERIATDVPGNWNAGIDRINRIENQLFSSPDPSRVDEIMVPECSCYTDTKNRLMGLQQKNLHVAGDNLRIDSATLIQAFDEDRVQLFMVLSDNGKPVVDSKGTVVSQSPTVDRVGMQYTLVRGTDKHWRIADRGSLEDIEVK